MTLIELLVVLAIIMLLAAATIPRLRPEIDRSRIREAARSLQLYLSSARNQAISTGKSCGVMIERLAAEPGCSMSLTQVETPSPYCGDFSGSVVRVAPHHFTDLPPDSPFGMLYPTFAVCDLTFDVPPSVPIYPGDLIQVGYQGPWYTVCPNSMWEPLHQKNVQNVNIMDPKTGAVTYQAPGFAPIGMPPSNTSQSTIRAYIDVTNGQQVPFLVYPTPFPANSQPFDTGYPPAALRSYMGAYKIIRWPNKSAAAALQLPSPAAIDLTLSGPSTKQRLPELNPPPPHTDDVIVWKSSVGGDTTPVTIMFAPDGSVDRVYVANKATHPITPIALLVGKRENVNDPTGVANLQDLNNLWVAINPMTGMIITTDIVPSNAGVLKEQLFDSRLFVGQSNAMGGK